LYLFPGTEQDHRDVQSSVPSIRHFSCGRWYYTLN